MNQNRLLSIRYGNASIIHKPIRISLYVEIYLYFFVVFKICMYTILVLLFLYICWCTFCYAHIRMCTIHKIIHTTKQCNTIPGNIQCNTNAKNQVGWKARTFVSRSYQIKDNTVYYKLYFGMIWHISNIIWIQDLIKPLSALTFTYQMIHNLYWKGNIQYQNTRQYNTGCCCVFFLLLLLFFFAETNLSENTYIYSIHLYTIGKTHRNNLGFQYI